MRTKAIFLFVLVWMQLPTALVQAQLPPSSRGTTASSQPGSEVTPLIQPPRRLPGSEAAPLPSTAAPAVTDTDSTPEPVPGLAGDMVLGMEPHHQLSDWITGKRACNCHYPVGHDGPIKIELYLRSGVAMPFGGGKYGDNLSTGWAIQGGARTLFFEPSLDRAWAIDLSLLNIHNNMDQHVQVPLNFLDDRLGIRTLFGFNGIPGITLRSLNRTFANLGVGREWYLMGTANSPDTCWRMGVDCGGGWGSAKGMYFEIPHRTDVIGRAYCGFHTDLEIPCGCCTYQFGLRTEWSYTWTDILQHQNIADTQDILILANFGVRF